MRVLFDQGTPVPLRRLLVGHQVVTAYQRGWSTLRDGELLDAVEQAGFEVLVTTDTNLEHQQNLVGRRLAIVVLLSTSWPRIERVGTAVAEAVAAARPGSYTKVQIPR